MDDQSTKSSLELNENDEHLDCQSEDQVVNDDALQTEEDLPMDIDYGISEDYVAEVRKPRVGMVFQSDIEAFEFYGQYARSMGFSIRKSSSILRKDNTISRRIFCCSRESFHHIHSRGPPVKVRAPTRLNCKARLVIKLHKDGTYSVVTFVKKHNHELSPLSKMHVLRLQESNEDSEVGVVENMKYEGVGFTDIHSYENTEVAGFPNLNFTQVDCSNNLQRRPNKILEKGDAQFLLDYFQRRQRENSNFFYSIRMGENNQMCCCFWCDERSRIDYSFFGDIVCFDTTYKINVCEKPYAPFIGLNNHAHLIVFGCALVLDETVDSYIWVFQTFLDAMNGKHPKTIFTEQAVSIADVIKQVFPGTNHRLCLWHMYQDAMKHLSPTFEQFPSFEEEFKSCLYYDEPEEEFQLRWNTLLHKYSLEENEWLQDLYQLHEKWAQIYGHEIFSADIASPERSDYMIKFIKNHFRRDLHIREFITQYERLTMTLREKETHQDLISGQTKPNLRTNWPAEARAAEIYTRKIFTLFQNEYVSTLDLFLENAGEGGTTCTYKVSSFRKIRPHTVTFDSSDDTVKCSCKKFELTGILCAHTLKVLHDRRLLDLPSQYYLNRWSKNARFDVVVGDCSSSLTMQRSEFSQMAPTIAMKSASSEDSCKFGKRLLTGSLVELDTLKTDFDQAELHHNIRMYDDVDEACGNISSPDVHHKQAKGKHVVKGEGGLKKKAREKEKIQRKLSGIKGQVGQVSDGAVGIVSSHLHNTQGSIELDDKAALNLIITSHTGKRRSMPPDDKAWNHGTKVTNGSKCNYCHKVMKGGGVCRLKHHIARTQFDVDPCYEVPVEVSEKWFRVMYPIAEAMRAKRKRGGASSSTNLNPMDSVSCQEYEVGPVSRQEFETLVRRVALLEDKQNHQNNCLRSLGEDNGFEPSVDYI